MKMKNAESSDGRTDGQGFIGRTENTFRPSRWANVDGIQTQFSSHPFHWIFIICPIHAHVAVTTERKCEFMRKTATKRRDRWTLNLFASSEIQCFMNNTISFAAQPKVDLSFRISIFGDSLYINQSPSLIVHDMKRWIGFFFFELILK